MSGICKFYNLEETDGQHILKKISEMVEKERRIYGVVYAEKEHQTYGDIDWNDYVLSIGLDVYYCIKNHCLKNHVFDNPPIYESGIICSPYMSAQLEFEVLTPDVFSPWTVVLRKKSKPFTLYRPTLRTSTYDLHPKAFGSFIKDAMSKAFDFNVRSQLLNYAANDILTTKTLYNEMCEPKQKHIKNIIFNNPATIVFWNDKTKTVVKAQDEEFDPEKGLAMAVTKKCFGNKGKYYYIFKKWVDESKAVDNKVPEYNQNRYIKNVIFNDPATIVFWNDGTKTVVKAADGENFDPGKGLAMAIAKKYFGNRGNYYDVFRKWLPKEKTEEKRLCSECKYFSLSTTDEPCRSCFIASSRVNWKGQKNLT